jgi:hypothetical protein
MFYHPARGSQVILRLTVRTECVDISLVIRLFRDGQLVGVDV